MIKEIVTKNGKTSTTYTVKTSTTGLKELSNDIVKTVGTGKTIKVTVTK
jgi:hypothetical protein